MVKKISCFQLFLLLVSPIFASNTAIDTAFYKERSRALYYAGRNLASEGRYVEAIDSFQLFLEYRIQLYGKNSTRLGSPYLALGINHKNIGRFDTALKYLKLAENSYSLKKDDDNNSLAALYVNIGNVYRAKLDYKNALNYYNRALDIYLNQKPIDNISLTDAYYSYAEINYLLGNYDLVKHVVTENIPLCDEYNLILYNELLAVIHQMSGKYQLATSYYRETVKLALNYYDEADIELAEIYLTYSEFLLDIGNYDESFSNLALAYEIISKTQKSRGEQLSRYYELLGNIYDEKKIEAQQVNSFKNERKNNLNKSIKWFVKALNALHKSNTVINVNDLKMEDCISFLDCLALLEQLGDAHVELALLDEEQKSELYANALNQALTFYQSASRITQQARREISSDESKVQLANLEYSTFTKTIETAFLAYEHSGDNSFLELGFYNSEQLKSSSIFDKLSSDLAQENSLIPDSIIQYEKKLNSTISIFNEKIFEENSYDDTDSTLVEEYKQIVFKAARERDELNRMLEEEYSEYYNLKYSNNTLSTAEIQRKLKKNEVILHYTIIEPHNKKKNSAADTNAHLLTFRIGKQEVAFERQILNSKHKKAIEEVYSFMSNPAYIFTDNRDSKNFCVASQLLYNVLIAPHSSAIQNKDLIIIPDGKLNYIAFDGLLQSLPDTSGTINFSKLNYLLNDYNINYGNSANILFQNQTNKQKLSNQTLAFAPIYDMQEFELANVNYVLLPLPGVQKEVDAIANTVKTKIYRGDDASEYLFRTHCKDYDILHLAMHAYLNDSLPAFSRLAFSPNINADSLKTKVDSLKNDGWLNTSDIYNLDLSARLTVLSACNTGVGKLQKGEGMMSLARGFLFAGCPSIVMSLWEVEDESGTQIMSSFYKNLKKGKTKDEALRYAKLNYLRNANSRLAHPHYWMSFKSIGDNSPIYTSYDLYFFAILILLILAFAIDQGVRMYKIRKNSKS